jgi:hypothetical protein
MRLFQLVAEIMDFLAEACCTRFGNFVAGFLDQIADPVAQIFFSGFVRFIVHDESSVNVVGNPRIPFTSMFCNKRARFELFFETVAVTVEKPPVGAHHKDD